jgi:hypothetical protein
MIDDGASGWRRTRKEAKSPKKKFTLRNYHFLSYQFAKKDEFEPKNRRRKGKEKENFLDSRKRLNKVQNENEWIE